MILKMFLIIVMPNVRRRLWLNSNGTIKSAWKKIDGYYEENEKRLERMARDWYKALPEEE